MNYPIELLQQFETLINDGSLKDDLMSIEQLHGFLCAITSNPFTVPTKTWLSAVFANDPKLMNHSSAATISDIAVTLQSIIEKELVKGDTVYPLIFENGKVIDLSEAAIEQLASWSAGYMGGISLNQQAWLKSGHHEIYSLLTPISAFAQFFDGVEPKDANNNPIDAEKIRATYLGLLPAAISNLFHFWREHQHCHHHNVETFRYEKPKVGRNELCPCDSGKKFKKCCGS